MGLVRSWDVARVLNRASAMSAAAMRAQTFIHEGALAELQRPAQSAPQQEVSQCSADVGGTFEIAEVPAVPDRDQRGIWNGVRNMLGDLDRDEVAIAGDDECRNAQPPQLRHEIVARDVPRVAVQL